MQRCTQCLQEKPATTEFFYPRKDCKSGLFQRCRVCVKAYRDTNKTRINASVSALFEKNKERYRLTSAAWREKNRDASAARTRQWCAENGHLPEVKARKAAYGKKWRTEKAHKNVAKSVKHRTEKMLRTPCWFDDWHAFVVEEAAHLARTREAVVGGKWHVDHVIPLQGRLVSGLHVMDNLQVVPAVFNIRKLNHFNPTVGPVRFLG